MSSTRSSRPGNSSKAQPERPHSSPRHSQEHLRHKTNRLHHNPNLKKSKDRERRHRRNTDLSLSQRLRLKPRLKSPKSSQHHQNRKPRRLNHHLKKHSLAVGLKHQHRLNVLLLLTMLRHLLNKSRARVTLKQLPLQRSHQHRPRRRLPVLPDPRLPTQGPNSRALQLALRKPRATSNNHPGPGRRILRNHLYSHARHNTDLLHPIIVHLGLRNRLLALDTSPSFLNSPLLSPHTET